MMIRAPSPFQTPFGPISLRTRNSVNLKIVFDILTLSCRFGRILVDDGDDGIGGVGDDGAEDTSDVTSSEGDHELLGLGALSSWLGHNVLVEGLDGLFEAGELHHCVWNLPHPQRLETSDEGSVAFLSAHLGEALAESGGVVGGLDSDLNEG